jgi:hypothetical protein
MDMDINGDVYLGGRAVSSTGYIIDLDVNGNLVWARKVNGYEIYDIQYSQRDGSLYILGVDAANPYTLILKMDIYGNLIWQRRLALTVVNNPRTSKIRPDFTSDYIYVTNIQGAALAKLNTDGSLGSFDNYTYQVSNVTLDDVTANITIANSTYTPSTSAASSTTDTLTLSNYSSLVQYFNTY